MGPNPSIAGKQGKGREADVKVLLLIPFAFLVHRDNSGCAESKKG